MASLDVEKRKALIATFYFYTRPKLFLNRASYDVVQWLSVDGSPGQKVYRFHYSPSRGSDVAEHLLDGFQGAVMSDDWSVYGKVCEKLQLTHINCCDHARRKFKDALIVEPKNKKKKGKLSRADIALQFFKKLYAIERGIKDLSADQKYKARQEKSVSVWDEFIAWMEKQIPLITPKSKLGVALNYTYKLKDKLRYFCEDGALPISNQIAENAIRPFAIARKNFLFF